MRFVVLLAILAVFAGFGLGDEEGFAESIRNTQGGGYYKRNDDDDDAEIPEEVDIEERPHFTRYGEPQVARRNDDAPPARPPARRPPPRRRPVRRPANGAQGQRLSGRQASGENAQLPAEHRSRFPGEQPQLPSFGLLPPPQTSRQTPGGTFQQQGQLPGTSVTNGQRIIVRPGTRPTIVINQTPSHTRPRVTHPTIGPAIGDLLRVDAGTPADTDHVPSFAAKMFVVREAPTEFFPPGYEVPFKLFPRLEKRVEVPRTKFFCEEQKYLPGIYADVQLGCKVFHLCLPAAMGNTLTSFMCPNMTLFDQSIMQCNYWYYVNCENSPKNYDANLQMALSYRKMNAAQLPLTAVRNFDNVALLSHNSEEMKSHKTVAPADPSIADNLAFRRIGRAEVKDARERMDDFSDGIPRQPRTLFGTEGEGKVEEKGEEEKPAEVKDGKTREGEKKKPAEDKDGKTKEEEKKKPTEDKDAKTREKRSSITSHNLPLFYRKIRRS
ncbi:uncharacterized protein LOC135204109 isoform X2 [Macrobrachium nipponense]|uniref:uncharacterized protein LOC135204109 isoform X2 n=1 Tax=Macrobrachium nipponense TaxID=159736 RepID=UPI0030C7FAC1